MTGQTFFTPDRLRHRRGLRGRYHYRQQYDQKDYATNDATDSFRDFTGDRLCRRRRVGGKAQWTDRMASSLSELLSAFLPRQVEGPGDVTRQSSAPLHFFSSWLRN